MRRWNKDIVEHLESIPFKEARALIYSGDFAPIDSDKYKAALSWLSGKEQDHRDAQQHKTFIIAIVAMINAIAATILAIIAIFI